MLHGCVRLILAPMERLAHALKQAQVRSHAPAKVLDLVDEWRDMGENLFKSFVDCVSDIESREKSLSSLGESLEKRFKELEEREREFEASQRRKKRELSPEWEDFRDAKLREEELDGQLKLVHEHIESLELSQREVERLRLLEFEKLKEIEKKERGIDLMGWSVEKQLREVKQREKEFDSFRDGKLRELASKEEILSRKREEFVNEVKLASEKFRERENLGSGLIKRLELALSVMEGMKVTLDERFKEMETRTAVAEKSLTEILTEAHLVRESLDEQLTEVEEMEKEFNSFREDKMQELESKERQLGVMRIELLKEFNLMDEKLTEKLKEFESWETTVQRSLAASLNDADLIRESLDKRFKEFVEKEKEFKSFQEDKLQSLESREQQLSIMRTELLKEVKLMDEKLNEQQKLGHHLLKCLDDVVAKKLKVIEPQELTTNGACETSDASTEDADSTRESANIPFKELEKSENVIKLEEDVDISKENELELKEGSLGFQRKEHEFKEQHLKEVDQGEKNLDSVRESAQTCLKVNLAGKDRQPERRPRQSESKQKQNKGLFQESELKQSQLADPLDAHSIIVEPDKSVQDEKELEMFINDTEKDPELMCDEVFKVLLRSSDPAKLVLDAMEGFCSPHWRRGDMRRGIILLDQLTKMSPNILSRVREAAHKLASEWKSKLRTSAENHYEVLCFLHLLAAYNLSSRFDKDEIFSFLKMVARHKQTPELWRILGLTESLPGLIQNLINEKQFLLASIYIYECELENVFPQAAVVNYYLQHAKFSAKAKCSREHDSSEKAIANEIAHLRVAIEHIIKYGLESECSLDTLTARVKQLERERAILRNGNGKPSSPRSIQRQNVKERKAQQKGSEEGSWHQGSKRKEGPVNFHKPWHRMSKRSRPLGFRKV